MKTTRRNLLAMLFASVGHRFGRTAIESPPTVEIPIKTFYINALDSQSVIDVADTVIKPAILKALAMNRKPLREEP